MLNKGYYFIMPRFWLTNLLYKVYFTEGKIYFAKVGGQFYSKKSALIQLNIFSLPFLKHIERKRENIEYYYDNIDFENSNFLNICRNNKILNRFDIKEINIKEFSYSLWIAEPVLGKLTIKLNDDSIIKLLILDGQDFKEINDVKDLFYRS